MFAYEDIWNGINLTDLLEPRGSKSRAAARMSLHLTDNVKEPTRFLPRLTWFRASVFRLGEARCRGGPKWPPPLL